MIAWLSANSEVLYLVITQHQLALQVHRKISQHLNDTIMKKSGTCCTTQITALSVSHKLQKKKNPAAPKYTFNTSRHWLIILEWPCIWQWKTGCVHTRNTRMYTYMHTHTHVHTHKHACKQTLYTPLTFTPLTPDRHTHSHMHTHTHMHFLWFTFHWSLLWIVWEVVLGGSLQCHILTQ